MKEYRRAKRVGLASILLALILRLWAEGVPEMVVQLWNKQNIAEEKTGQAVRFSPSLQVFSPNFMESPPPSLPEPTEPPIPSFSDPEPIELYYAVQKTPDIGALLEKPLQWELYGEEPTVLILHTHSTESYTQHGENYVETSAWRTLDENYNMLSIGAEVARLLNDRGIPTVQDRQLHDYPSYNGSYASARKAIREYRKEFPSLKLILDLHRDASGEDASQMRTLATVNGSPSAQLMVVIGANHENYEENVSLGLKLHAQLEHQSPGIMRPLQLRGARYNQDLFPGALLIEVGAAGNSHTEAMTAAKELAGAVIALARGTV